MRTYQNPVKKNGDFADPFVLRYNGRYYLYCTNPDIRCWSSLDLTGWTLEGPVITDQEFPGLVPFAPEVVYWNGKFYMYTSPHGFGHYVLESDSPVGPFHKITDNIHHNIDLSVFVDDDGRWYAYWASEQGIMGCEMHSPVEFGEGKLIGAYLEGWTEGPFVVKRNGRYHLTYTGNHFLSKGYRIHAAVSDHPLGPYCDNRENPVIVRTDGDVTGLGHSSTVTGPNLMDDYIVYHNLNPDRSRDLNIDRIELRDDGAVIAGPTCSPMPAPQMPYYSDCFEEEAGRQWTVQEGMWESRDGFRFSKGAFSCVCCHELPCRGAAEFHVAAVSDRTRCYGVQVGKWKIKIDAEEKVLALEYENVVRQKKMLWEDFDSRALHSIRIRNQGEGRIFFDDLQLLVSESCLTGPIGYFADGAVCMGYTAIAKEEDRRSDYPVPALLPRETDCHLVVKHAGDYILAGTGKDSTAFAVKIDGKEKKLKELFFDGQLYLGALQLEEGIHKISFSDRKKGTVRIYEAPCAKEDAVIADSVRGYDKIKGKHIFGDFELEAELAEAELKSEGSSVGVLFHASEFSDGGEGEDKELGTNFFIGYSAAVEKTKLVLCRHRYNRTVLCEKDCHMEFPLKIKIVMHGNQITVWQGERLLLEYRDEEPVLTGFAGFHVRDAFLKHGKLWVKSEF